ncbi:MAG: conserved rane protein of unknown function [Frankiales bacterium]|nr:conserved rane protein of unknown function [Frankiales bacterium]
MTSPPTVPRLDRLQRRRPWIGFPLAVVYKYVDDSGGYLAALITYYAFLALFPLLLLAATVLGLVLAGDPAAQQAVLKTALRQFPVIGPQLDEPSRLGGGTLGVVVGSLGALYGGLGAAMAVQTAMNVAWRVPRNSRGNPFQRRGNALLLLGLLGVGLLGATALSVVGSGTGVDRMLLQVVAVVGSVLVNTGVLVVAFRLGTARRPSVGQVLPGAAAAAVAWQLLQTFGARYVSHVVKSASATNSVFALVLGLVAFLYLSAVALVLCLEVNAVRVDRLWPRALLTPFTDAVQLTEGDERAYADQARAQRNKGFEQIEVTFDRDA